MISESGPKEVLNSQNGTRITIGAGKWVKSSCVCGVMHFTAVDDQSSRVDGDLNSLFLCIVNMVWLLMSWWASMPSLLTEIRTPSLPGIKMLSDLYYTASQCSLRSCHYSYTG